ncbi:MAG: hypothetical protein ACE5H9_13015 [Anaerolineae bacterium]
MDTDQSSKYEAYYGYRLCCAPGGRSGLNFWGVLLVVLGGLWLANNFGLVPGIGNFIFPVFLITWGSFLLWRAIESHIQDDER